MKITKKITLKNDYIQDYEEETIEINFFETPRENDIIETDVCELIVMNRKHTKDGKLKIRLGECQCGAWAGHDKRYTYMILEEKDFEKKPLNYH